MIKTSFCGLKIKHDIYDKNIFLQLNIRGHSLHAIYDKKGFWGLKLGGSFITRII